MSPLLIIVAVFIGCALMLVLLHWGKDARDQRLAADAEKLERDAIQDFIRQPLSMRGLAVFIRKGEPNTLTICRYANIIPESRESILLGPMIFHNPATLSKFIIETETIHLVRWLYPDGKFTIIKARPGGSLVHGENFVHSSIADAYKVDLQKTDAVMAESEIETKVEV